MEDPNAKPIEETKEQPKPHPMGLNRAQRRKLNKIGNTDLKELSKIPTSEFKPLDVSGLEYEEGVAKPIHDPTWPWMLEEVTQRLSDGKIIAHKMTGMSTKTVSGIRIHYAKPEDHLTFRRGKPLAIEFKDATTTMKLTRQSKIEKPQAVATSAEEAIEMLKGKDEKEK